LKVILFFELKSQLLFNRVRLDGDFFLVLDFTQVQCAFNLLLVFFSHPALTSVVVFHLPVHFFFFNTFLFSLLLLTLLLKKSLFLLFSFLVFLSLSFCFSSGCSLCFFL
jgi:hypothetical protein